MNARNLAFVICTIVGAALDQWTKWWIVQNVELYRGEIPVIEGFLSIVHTRNHGAAFGVMQGQQMVFLVFTVIALVIILDLFRRLRPDDLFTATTLGLILSGAIGNGIDRVRQGFVVDFIRVYTDAPQWREKLISWFGTSEWPTFNVADAALVVGVSMFLIRYTFMEEDESVEEAEDEPEKLEEQD